MKKSTLIVALIAASTFAVHAADVYSSNIVGYSKVTLSPGYTMVGAPFQTVGATGTVNIQDIVKTDGLAPYDWGTGAVGDSLTIFDPAVQAYATTYLWSDADPYSMGTENKWFVESLFEPADIDLPVGSAFFIISKSSTNFVGTLAGEVAAGAAGQDIAFSAGYTMIANPFPYELDLNANMIPTGLVPYDWGTGAVGDSLTIFDPAVQAYATTYLWSDADPYSMGTENKWFIESSFEPASVKIPIGGAFFIISSAGGTLDFTAP